MVWERDCISWTKMGMKLWDESGVFGLDVPQNRPAWEIRGSQRMEGGMERKIMKRRHEEEEGFMVGMIDGVCKGESKRGYLVLWREGIYYYCR